MMVQPAAGRTTLGMPHRREVLAVVGVGGALVVVARWASDLQRAGTDLKLFAAPFFGDWRPRPGRGFLVPVAIAAVVVLAARQVSASCRWRAMLLAAWATTVVWSVALSSATGWAGLTRSLRSRYDYAAVLPDVRRLGLSEFIRGYASHLSAYPTHVKSHPPGMVVFLRGLELIGLRGTGWASTVVILLAATVPCAVAIVVRAVAGEGVARPLLPFLVCGPWTLLVATVADGLFTAVTAWATVLAVLAATTRSRQAAPALAVGAGLAIGVALSLSYGLAPLLAALALAAVVPAGRVRLLLPMAAGALAVVVAWAIVGFGYLAGFEATRAAYRAGAAAERPYRYFLVANLVVLAVMVGPTVIAALCRRLDPAVIPLVVATLAAVAVADVSGLSKGEVERIWLPFLPFVTVAATRLARRPGAVGWLTAQAGVALVLQLLVEWPW
jgi:hypothetical protein